MRDTQEEFMKKASVLRSLLCLPRTCIRGQGFVGCSWGILRFFNTLYHTSDLPPEALEVLSSWKKDQTSVLFILYPVSYLVYLIPLPSLVSLSNLVFSPALYIVVFTFIYIQRLFYDLSLYPPNPEVGEDYYIQGWTKDKIRDKDTRLGKGTR
jgi:hypothetical protein